MMWKFSFSLLVILHFVSLPALTWGPWGKDAELSYHCNSDEKKCCEAKGFGVRFSEVMIGFHQNVISEADGPRSHFKPSSSQYALDAIRKYGFFRGYIMGCDRLMRENSEKWIYPVVCGDYDQGFKYDPVQ